MLEQIVYKYYFYKNQLVHLNITSESAIVKLQIHTHHLFPAQPGHKSGEKLKKEVHEEWTTK